jgi:hypothetical protein
MTTSSLFEPLRSSKVIDAMRYRVSTNCKGTTNSEEEEEEENIRQREFCTYVCVALLFSALSQKRVALGLSPFPLEWNIASDPQETKNSTTLATKSTQQFELDYKYK